MTGKYWDIPMNFIGGCSACSVGCTHCWAADCASKRLANRPLYKGLTKNGKWTGEVRVMPELIKIIGGKPKTIFWCNMADMFHEKVKFEDVDKAFAAMALMPQHKHLVLTKRIERMAEYIPGRDWGEACNKILRKNMYLQNEIVPPLQNVHLGVTICNQAEADEKLPILLQIPAAYRWISFEPLLGPIQDACKGFMRPRIPFNRKMIQGWFWEELSSVIIGCESGPHRRRCKPEWIKNIVEQCKAVGVDWLVKQVEINGKVCHDPRKCAKYLGV